jgi:hypothetical protein
MSRAPLRASVVELESTRKLIVPAPLPPPPDKITIHAFVLLTVQTHSAAVVIVTLSAPPLHRTPRCFSKVCTRNPAAQ